MATTPPGELHEGKDTKKEEYKLINWIRRQFPIVTGGGAAGQANWPIGAVRWYGASTIRGSDNAAGYSDASCADLGTKPKLTLAGLAAILPRIGAGRKICIVLEGDFRGQGGLDVLLSSMSGYAANFPLVVATGTNATAGAVAFAGDMNDRTSLAGVTADGMNAAGYNPTGALSASLIQCLKVGGGAPGFAAEPAIPLGVSMRFSASTTTAALQNQCRMVRQVTGTDTLTPLSAFPAVPLATDTFYLEQPGTYVDAMTLSLPASSTITSCQIAGFRTTSGLAQFTGAGAGIFSFCDVTGFLARGADSTLRPTYTDENGNTITRGAGLRIAGSLTRFHTLIDGNFTQEAFICTGETALEGGVMFSWGNGTSTWAGLSVLSLAGAVGNDNDQPIAIIGGRFHASEPAARIRGLVSLHGVSAGLYAAQSSFTISSLDISGMGANPAIRLRGKCSFFADINLTGTTGNTDVGLDLSAGQGCTILLESGNAPTLTGTVGDIRLADGTIATWAGLTAVPGTYITAAGNTFVVS